MSADTSILQALIVGAGFGGIGMAIALRRAGVTDFLVTERGKDVGGVWRDNTYPGAACDIPSHLYSFSFEPNPAWTHTFARQDEIHAYLKHCVDKYGIRPHLRLGIAVEGAYFDDESSLWRVQLAGGRELLARVLVTATGQLSNPQLPRIDGLESFRGPAFHSARWDHGVDLAGKRVAVIGTGASSAQLVPALAPKVASLSVFQRSPAYLMPRRDRAYRDWERALFQAWPSAMRLQRALIYMKYESRALAFSRAKWMLEVAAGLPFRRMLRRHVADPRLREKLTPAYPIGCKRILVSNDYLAAFSRPNVTLVTDPIARMNPGGIETADGRQHEVEAIVYSTGFAATPFLAPMHIVGRDGLELNTAWRAGASAYLGMSVPGFPNFFMLYGPNTNLGHNSIVYMLESQIAHVLRCLRAMHSVWERGADQVEVLPEAHGKFDAAVQAGLARSAWVGCSSWYLDEQGRNAINWPGFSLSYRWLTRHAPLKAYRFSRGALRRRQAQERANVDAAASSGQGGR